MSSTRTGARHVARFEIRTVTGLASGNPRRRLISSHGKESTALGVVAGLLAQWAKSPGKIPPDTRVSIVDTDDGGKLFEMHYAGYDQNDILQAIECLQANGFTLKEVATNG